MKPRCFNILLLASVVLASFTVGCAGPEPTPISPPTSSPSPAPGTTAAVSPSMITVDGHRDDWISVQAVTTDPMADAPSEAYDLKALYTLQDSGQLFLAIEFATAKPTVPVHIFINDAYLAEANPDPNGGEGVISKWPAKAKVDRIRIAYGDIIEVSIPLEKLGDAREFNINVHSKGPGPEWESIDIMPDPGTLVATPTLEPISLPEPIETHEGDIIVNRGEVLEIKNKTLNFIINYYILFQKFTQLSSCFRSNKENNYH